MSAGIDPRGPEQARVSVASGADRIVLRLLLPRSIETVWAALTEPGQVARWWGDHVRFDATPHGRLVERWPNATGRTVVTTGQITRFAPPSRLKMSWADDDWPVATSVSLRLKPGDDGTRLTLEHAGWAGFPDAVGNRLREEHTAGWTRHLRSLAVHLARNA